MSRTLDQLALGQSATVVGFTEFNAHVQRIMALGLVEDTRFSLTRRAPAGDPIELNVMGDHLSIRREDAKRIQVKTES